MSKPKDWYRSAQGSTYIHMPWDEASRPVKGGHYAHIVEMNTRHAIPQIQYWLIYGGGSIFRPIPKETVMGKFQDLDAAKAAYKILASSVDLSNEDS